jgi:hypothetical protein
LRDKYVFVDRFDLIGDRDKTKGGGIEDGAGYVAGSSREALRVKAGVDCSPEELRGRMECELHGT